MATSRRASNSVQLAVALLGTFACAPSAEVERRPVAPIIAKFDRFLRAHNQCNVNSDCVQMDAKCLRGCGVAVNKQHEKATAKAIEELNNEYMSASGSCSHWLCLPTAARCVEQRCSVVVVDEEKRAPDAATDAAADAAPDATADAAIDAREAQ